MTLPIVHRPPQPQDLPFIIDSWMKSYRNSEFAHLLTNEQYYEFHRPVVENLLKRSLVSVLCDPHDSSHIYGYVVYEFINSVFTIHYVYIKSIYRKLGLTDTALQLLNSKLGTTVSYITHLDKVIYKYDEYYKKVKRKSWYLKNKEKYKLNYVPYLIV